MGTGLLLGSRADLRPTGFSGPVGHRSSGGRDRVDEMHRTEPQPQSHPLRGVAGVFLLAWTIRLLALGMTASTWPAGDEADWLLRAARSAQGLSGLEDGARAPGLIFFYAAAFKVFGAHILVAKLANGLVSALTIWPVYVLGRRLGGERVGWWAAFAVAVYPTFIAFSHYLWPAPLYIFLVSTGIAWLVVGLEKPGSRDLPWLAAAGLCLGLSALVKESGLGFPVVAALWILWRSRERGRRALARGALVMGMAALVMMPWVLQMQRPDRPFALITRTGYMNLFVGNHPQGHGVGMEEYPTLGATPRETELVARDRAWHQIQSRGFAWPFEKLAREGPRFFTPTSFAVRRLLAEPDSPGGWRYVFAWSWLDSRWVRGAAVVAVVASYLVALALGPIGLILSRRSEITILFGAFIGTQLLPSMVMFSMSRFRLASMVFLLIGAAAFAVRGRADWAMVSPSRRLWAVGTAVLLLGMAALDGASVLESTGR